MAIYQPSFIYPDARSGLGRGVVDATKALTVSWRINGASALTAFQITIYTNNAASTQKYTTGKITSGCPAYGTTSAGAIQLFSYTISASALSSAGITNGNAYKLVITQWWSANDSVTQSSASAFITRKTPTLSISAIGSGGVVSTRYYTFTGNYAQAQGDALNWFRWQVAYANDRSNPLFDSGNISGTMDISCTYDGFFPDVSYSVRLTAQTENGIEADTGWVNFSCSYSIPETTGAITVACANGTDAVLVEWSGVGYYPGTASGYYSISADNIATIGAGSSISWKSGTPSSISFAAPWSVIWRGTLANQNATIFTVTQSSGNIVLSYDYALQSLILKKGSTTLATQSGIINAPRVSVVLTPDTLYIRTENPGGGLYPSLTLYPSATLYPMGDETVDVQTYSIPVTYTQYSVTGLAVGGYQQCEFIEILKGEAAASVIAEVITNGTYVPEMAAEDYLLVDWTDGINAGTLDIGSDTLIGFALYRRRQDEATLQKVAEMGKKSKLLYDYGAGSQQGPYTYYLFPKGQNTYIASPITSGEISPCFWNWTLMECEETESEDVFSVLAAYRFRYNVETDAMSNNNSPSILPNFTPYPKIQLSPQNYKTGAISGLIGKIDWTSGQPQYSDSIELRDAIMALSVSQNPMFLKNRKGDVIRVKISAPISSRTGDNTIEQTQTATIPWVEVGSAEGISLYSASYVEATAG